MLPMTTTAPGYHASGSENTIEYRLRSDDPQPAWRFEFSESGMVIRSVTTANRAGEPIILDTLAVPENEVLDLTRTAALGEKPPGEWVFWPNGICEPVVVSYKGPAVGCTSETSLPLARQWDNCCAT